MGVSSTARLPSLGAQSIPPLFSHLQHTSNAKVVSRWSITVRSFRAVPVPTNAWPQPDQYDSDFTRSASDEASVSGSANAISSSGSSQQAGSGSNSATSGGVGSSASGAPPLTKPRTMWQVWMSDFPGTVFVIVEDTGRASRAKVWRDWELAMKKWKKQKRQEIEERRKRDAQKQTSEAQQTSTEATNEAAGGSESAKLESSDQPAGAPDNTATADKKEDPMDVDTANTARPGGAAETKPDEAITSLTSTAADNSSSTDKPAENLSAEALEEDPIETAGPRPTLRLPSHTRYTVSALTSSMSAMLTGLNLPPPHGAPVGTAGPGAWVPRGAAVSIEGLVLEINSQGLNALPGISPALASVSTADDATLPARGNGVGSNGSAGVDWRVRVGSVMGGGGRSAGAIVDAEFLPISTLLPTAKFMSDFLYSLFPPGLVPMPPPTAALAAPGIANSRTATTSLNGSTTGTPRINNAALPTQGDVNNHGSAPANASTSAGASYTIGGGGGAGSTPPNRNFNIPVVSDQLWEEVVPPSGESWRRRIARRSQQMKVAARVGRRQRKNAATSAPEQNLSKTSASDSKLSADGDAFGWHTFGEDDGATEHGTAPANGVRQDEEELSSSDSEPDSTLPSGTAATAGGLTGTAVTMQQAEEDDDDDDDDRPLGAPAWSNAKSSTSNAPAPTPAAVKKEETVQLIFQGLRPDEDGVDQDAVGDGWTGIERGRRIAFQYVQMLRAEGII